MRRRDLLKLFTAAAMSGFVPRLSRAAEADELYDIGKFGNARVLHMTDTHAQLEPVHFREPSVNLGVGTMAGHPPHLVGEAFLKYFDIAPQSRLAHAFTCLDFAEAAHRYGRLGGFPHLKTLVDRLRAEAGAGHSLLLDGGDLWQGGGLANLTHGEALVDAANLLGIEAMTAHWEFTYGEERLRANIKRFKGEFLAQNVFLTEEAAFDNKPAFDNTPAFDSTTGRAFKPATIRELGGFRIGVIGQALPYVPIAHPKRFTPDWTFGIREPELQKLVDGLRQKDRVDAVILLSHNGMDLDLKLAGRVTGIDVILGGHTHDAVPQPVTIANASGRMRFCSRKSSPSPASSFIAVAISTAPWISSSATRCGRSSMPNWRCRRVSAGATRCCPGSRSRWRTCCRRRPSPTRKSTCRR
jgi:sulfur-oxidizing protein SoxB